MNLTLKELNEIYYCLSKVLNSDGPSLADKEAITKLKTKIWDEIDMIEYESQNNDDEDDFKTWNEAPYGDDEDDEDLGPEYDSAGFTEDDRIINGQYRVISNKKADTDAKSSSKYQQWWDINKDRILAEDKLKHDLGFKSNYTKYGDY